MKASDISDEQFLAALNFEGWTYTWDLVERLGYPEKIVRAKARTMIRRRKTVDGCVCGCRGDFERVYKCDYDTDCKEPVVHNVLGMRYCKKHGPGGGHIMQLDCTMPTHVDADGYYTTPNSERQIQGV